MNLFTQFAKPLNKVSGSYIGYSLFLTSKKFIDKHFSPLFLTLITTNKKIRKDKKNVLKLPSRPLLPDHSSPPDLRCAPSVVHFFPADPPLAHPLLLEAPPAPPRMALPRPRPRRRPRPHRPRRRLRPPHPQRYPGSFVVGVVGNPNFVVGVWRCNWWPLAPRPRFVANAGRPLRPRTSLLPQC